MGKKRRREKRLRLPKQMTKKIKKKGGRMTGRKFIGITGEWTVFLCVAFCVVSFIALMFWAQYIGRDILNQKVYTTFQMDVLINSETFEVDTTLLDEQRQINLALRDDYPSYRTATIEIGRFYTAHNREFYSTQEGTWGDYVGDTDPDPNTEIPAGEKTYNIWSIIRGDFIQDISCFVGDRITIEVKLYLNVTAEEWSNGEYTEYTWENPRPLKYHYAITGVVGKDINFDEPEARLCTGTRDVQESMGGSDAYIQYVLAKIDRRWTSRSIGYERVGCSTLSVRTSWKGQ